MKIHHHLLKNTVSSPSKLKLIPLIHIKYLKVLNLSKLNNDLCQNKTAAVKWALENIIFAFLSR